MARRARRREWRGGATHAPAAWRGACSGCPRSITGARVIDVSARHREREVRVLIAHARATERPLRTQLDSASELKRPLGEMGPVAERQPVTAFAPTLVDALEGGQAG